MRLSLLLALYWDSGGARQRWRRLGPRQNDGRDGVLEDELLLVGGFKHDRVFVKASDTARQLRAAGQVNRDQGPFLARRVQKSVLNILLLLHVVSLFRRHPQNRSSAGVLLAPEAQIAETIDRRPTRSLHESEERRVGKECRSRWSPYH